MIKTFRKVLHWFSALSTREKVLVSGAALVALGYGVIYPVQYLQDDLARTQVAIERRSREYLDIGASLKSYQRLSGKLKQVEDAYERSQMTFEQVTSELDRIVKESIGNDNYELKKNPSNNPVGNDLEQQDFTLRVRSLNLEQLVGLLHKIEQGKSALFLGKIDIQKGAQATDLSATLEVSSVAKKRG